MAFQTRTTTKTKLKFVISVPFSGLSVNIRFIKELGLSVTGSGMVQTIPPPNSHPYDPKSHKARNDALFSFLFPVWQYDLFQNCHRISRAYKIMLHLCLNVFRFASARQTRTQPQLRIYSHTHTRARTYTHTPVSYTHLTLPTTVPV